MIRHSLAAAAAVLLAVGPAAAADKFTLKVETAPPPQELSDPVRGLLAARAMIVSDPAGKVVCAVWPREELTAPAVSGPAYTDLEESTVVGAVRFPDGWSDYRKQKVKPGVYTLRVGFQPMDGDHMGTAPYNEFCLLAPAGKDTKPDRLGAEELHELSSHSTTRRHPGVVLLFPNPTPADAPAVEARPQDHWVLSFKVPVAAGGKKVALGFSLVVVGHTAAE